MTTAETFDACKWAALSHPDVLWASYTAARHVLELGVQGDFVECGVFAGTQCAMMARAIIDAGETSRRVHLFDSFEGVPAPSEQDGGMIEDKMRSQTRCGIDAVKAYMAEWSIPSELLVYHHGLYSETIPPADRFSIAFLRIDCDLYESVNLVLQELYPWVSDRGVTMMDDYHFPGARLAFQECLNPYELGQIMWWRRERVAK